MFFTGLRTATKALRRVVELEALVAELGLVVKRLDEELIALQGAHNKLRGRFYSTRGGHDQDEETAQAGSREARRAAAFRKHGIIPGQPVNLDAKGH